MSVKSHLTYEASVHPENAVMYSMGAMKVKKKFLRICLKQLHSRVVSQNMSVIANY